MLFRSDAVGADHVLYGSDVRLLTSLKPRAITLIEGLPLSEKDEHFLVKATRLLKLSDAGIARRM